MAHLEYLPFSEVNLEDRFFDSLREGYGSDDFNGWYKRKATEGEKAYVLLNDNDRIRAFLYLKVEGEEEDYSNIVPVFPRKRRLKVGTLKVIAKGTRLGERVIKKVMDHALEENVDEVYVTVHTAEHTMRLISLLERFGFTLWGDQKKTGEKVYIKSLSVTDMVGNRYADYPMVNLRGARLWVLAIYPKFHTRMFPDSILKTESFEILHDTKPTNTISKIYLAKMDCISQMSPGDVVLIYRTGDGAGPARYRSVITSLCVVEEVKNIFEFTSEKEFMDYCEQGSVFEPNELEYFYRSKKYPHIIKMTYNLSMKKKVTNGDLIDFAGISPSYWGCFNILKQQLKSVLEMGNVNENLLFNKEW